MVGSSGGHLAQLLALEPFWSRYDRFWVTFPTADAVSLLGEERVYWCHHPTNRNIPNLLRNTILATRVLSREHPDLVVSTGAGAALPYFWLAPVYRAKTAFIEVVDRIERPTLTGRLVAASGARMFVQWEEQLGFYANPTLIGPLL